MMKGLILGLLLPAFLNANRDHIYKIELESYQNAIDLVPSRYLRRKEDRVKVALPDSGMMQGNVSFGIPETSHSLIIDLNGEDTGLPISEMEKYQSSSLSIGADGVWRDVVNFDGLRMEALFRFIEGDGVLGLGSHQKINDTATEGEAKPSFMDSIFAMEVLGMSIKSMYLYRMEGKIKGELWLGESPTHPKDALTRFNPALQSSGSWMLSLPEIRIDGHAAIEVEGGRAVIDCSTPMTILPVSIFLQITALMDVGVRESDGRGMLISRPMACEVLLHSMPTLHVSIATDEYVWDAAHYLLPSDDHGNCILGMMGYDAVDARGAPLVVLGSLFLLDRVTVFDHSTMHVGLTDYELNEDLAPIMEHMHELSQQEL